MTDKTYISVTDTAKLVRGALKAAFPGVTFSVRSRRYSGGASIDVAWTDGPTETEVEAVTGLYVGSTFDGMTDCKNYHDSILVDADGTPQLVHFGADFIFCTRSLSDGLVAATASMIGQRYAGCTWGSGPVVCEGACPGTGWISQGDPVYMGRDHYGRNRPQCSPECAARLELRYGHVRPAGSRAWRRVREAVGR